MGVNSLPPSIDADDVTFPPRARPAVGFGGTARVVTGGYLSSVARARRTGRVAQFSSVRPLTRLNSAIWFVTSLSPRPACVSGNEEIVGANHLASFLQVSTDLRIVDSRVVGKLQDGDVRKKRVESGGVLRSARRHFYTVEQFRLGNHRYADVGDRHGAQSVEDGLARALHDVGARVGVEHVSSHQGSRSWTGRSSMFVMYTSDATGFAHEQN